MELKGREFVQGATAFAAIIWLCSCSAGYAKHHDAKPATDAESKTTAAEAQAQTPPPPLRPENPLLKSVKTPFGPPSTGSSQSEPDDPLAGFSLSGSTSAPPGVHRLSLSDRLVPARLFMPGRMILGKSAEFTVKGKAGSWAAIAMADKDSGAKPIMGHKVRLGPDRKVVAIGQIPANGVLALTIDCPIEGDLIGQCLYFEAALWSKPDFSDVQVASVVSSESQEGVANGVLIAGEPPKKGRGIRIGAEDVVPMSQRAGSVGLESGKP